MATRIVSNQTRAQMDALLKHWESRWRTRRIVLYLPRVLMIALAIGIVLSLIVAGLRLLPPVIISGAVAAGIGIVVIAVSGGLRLFGKQGIEAARYFDQLFELQERVSTALELMDGRIQTVSELANFQIADAYEHAGNIDPRKHIRIEVRWLEWLGVCLMLIVLTAIIGLYALFGSFDDGPVLSAAAQAAIEQAGDDVRDITETIATDSGLTDDERTTLLETLEMSLDELSGDDITPQDAFVELSDLESELRDSAQDIRDELAARQAALDQAAETLQNPTEDTQTPNQEGTGSLDEALRNWQEALASLTPEQREELQRRLEEAARQTEGEQPAVSEDLSNLAEALQNATPEEIQQAFQEALENLEAIDSQQMQRIESAQSLENAANDARQASSEVAQSEQQGEQQQGEQQGEQQGDSQSEGQNSDGASQPGDQASSESQNAALSNDPNAQPILVQGNNPEAVPGSEMEGEGSGGSGEGESSGAEQAPGSPVDDLGTNNADGEGETTFEQIFTPYSIDADGTDNIILEADASDAPAIEGNFQDNPAGTVSVPYNQVFRTYDDAANRALDNDYVPLGMRDVVRDYFSSLAPASQP